jgi:hypothetical protein
MWQESVKRYEEQRRQWHGLNGTNFIVARLLDIGPSSRVLSPSTRGRRRNSCKRHKKGA